METHWALLVALVSTVACGNGNSDSPPTGGAGRNGGAEHAGGAQNAAGAEHGGGAENAAGSEHTGGVENSGGAENAAGADNMAGASQVEEPTLAAGPGAVDAGFENSSLFLTHMRQPMTGLPSSPHGIVQIFYSSNIEPVLGRESFSALPTGTIALKKQDRDGDGVVDQLMLMLKQPSGSLPAYGDWIFEQRDPATFDVVTSSASDSGFGDFCAGCHRGFPVTDWLAGTSLRN